MSNCQCRSLLGEQTGVNTKAQLGKAAVAYRDVEAKSWAVTWIDLAWNLGGGTPAEEAQKKKAMQSLKKTLEKSLKDLEDALEALKPGLAAAANAGALAAAAIDQWDDYLRKGKQRIARLKQLLG